MTLTNIALVKAVAFPVALAVLLVSEGVIVVALAAPPGLPAVPLSPGLTPELPLAPAMPLTTTVVA